MLIPDIHIPDHHTNAVNNLLELIEHYKPDEIVQTGDLLDMKGPARWSKGTAVEYEQNLQDDADQAIGILRRIRDVYDGPFRVIKGNHDVRAEKYLRQYAPALRHIRALGFAQLLNFDELEIDLHSGPPYRVAPGWVAVHGDQGRLARYGGGTALTIARQYGLSVACGHTHRAGLIPETTGLYQRHTVTGLELGHLMNEKKADYMKLPPNWQMAFGMLHISGKNVQPELIPIDKAGGFTIEGVTYR